VAKSTADTAIHAYAAQAGGTSRVEGVGEGVGESSTARTLALVMGPLVVEEGSLFLENAGNRGDF
jgi:hypothetical protein